MDINDLKSLAEQRFDHSVHRRTLRERVQAQLVVTHNGGQFRATPELIAFIYSWTATIMKPDDFYLEDLHGNPIKCDPYVLLKELKQAYQYAMNAWHEEFEQSKKIRKNRDVL